MSQHNYRVLFFGLAASFVAGLLPMNRAFANVPRPTPLEIRPVRERIQILTGFERAGINATEEAKNAIYVNSYIKAASLLKNFNV
ncbi:MAG: hypothetical protein PHY92_09405, partial [Alphaproteobacteria bacterium]|nr:hypothetical protein [Alphaproteobacteria bacterium]